MSGESQILVKVDKGTKQKMKKIRINWSAEIRRFIANRVSEERNLALAVILTERVFRKAKKKRFDSTAFIRKMRDARYGSSSG